MRKHHIYFKRYIPPWIVDEYDRLNSAYFGGFTSKQMEEDFDFNDMKSFVESHASEELKLWEKYSLFTGDEGQLRDKDGGFLLDKQGNWIQDWIADENGYLSDLNGNPILYSDGERVKGPLREDFLPYYDKWFPKDE